MKLGGSISHLAFATTKAALKATWYTAVGVSAATFHGAHLAGKGLGLAADYARAQRSMRDGDVVCEQGHVIDTTGVFECSACHWVWRGSIWLCPNPECGASTPFALCQDCGLAVRNPYRYGS